MLNKPRLRHTEFKGYHYIDNCAVLKSKDLKACGAI